MFGSLDILTGSYQQRIAGLESRIRNLTAMLEKEMQTSAHWKRLYYEEKAKRKFSYKHC